MMYSDNLILTNKSRAPLNLTNLFEDTFGLCDAVKDCKDADAFCKTASKHARWKCTWSIARDDATQTRLQYEDRLGNIYYLIANKTGNVCLKDVPDNDLVMELISRGYKVSR